MLTPEFKNIALILMPMWAIIWFMIAKYPTQGAALWGLAGILITVGFFIDCIQISIGFWVAAFICILVGGYLLFVLKYNPDLPNGWGQVIGLDKPSKKRRWFRK
jgi:hypothetical protein